MKRCNGVSHADRGAVHAVGDVDLLLEASQRLLLQVDLLFNQADLGVYSVNLLLQGFELLLSCRLLLAADGLQFGELTCQHQGVAVQLELRRVLLAVEARAHRPQSLRELLLVRQRPSGPCGDQSVGDDLPAFRRLSGCCRAHLSVQRARSVAHQVEHTGDQVQRVLLGFLLLLQRRTLGLQCLHLLLQALTLQVIGTLQVAVSLGYGVFALALSLGRCVSSVLQLVNLRDQGGQGRVELVECVELSLALAIQQLPVPALETQQALHQVVAGVVDFLAALGLCGGVFQLVNLRDQGSQGWVELHQGVVLSLALTVKDLAVLTLQLQQALLQAHATFSELVTRRGQLRERARQPEQHGDDLAALLCGGVLSFDQGAELCASIVCLEVRHLDVQIVELPLQLPLQVCAHLLWAVEVLVVGAGIGHQRLYAPRELHQGELGLVAVLGEAH